MFICSAQASDGFRLSNGKLITEGMSKSEIIIIAGTPILQEVEKMAIDDGDGAEPVKREILTYRLSGAIGGMYLVVITIENSKAVIIDSQQQDRL